MTGEGRDLTHLDHALRLASRSLGRVAPNPAVGCVIVSDAGAVVGRGWTAQGGRPHAETIALAWAGAAAKGATAYVSLEPCAHHGETAPCAEALIAAGIARVVAPLADPDPRVGGRGFAMLTGAGIAVTQGLRAAQARALNAGFFTRLAEGRPLVALKIAQSADGFVATPDGRSKWITSEAARRHGHFLRAQHDAVLAGIGTVLADDPLLTCRLDGMQDRSPLRVILDSRLRLPPSSHLAQSARDTGVLVFTTAAQGGEELVALGVEIERVEADGKGRPDLAVVLAALGGRGVTRVLVEAGPKVQTALLDRRLADLIHVYRAPKTLGSGLRSALTVFEAGELEVPARLNRVGHETLGPDLLESYALQG